MIKRMLILAFMFTEVALAQSKLSSQLVKLKAILEVAGADSGAQLGAYVKGVGDLNKDGYADVAVSAPGQYKTYIYYGGKTMSQTPSLTLKGGGHIVSGDFRGDGWIDLAVEIAFHDSVLVYFNGPGGLDTIPDLVLTLVPLSDYFGYEMTAGDFNGDGYIDLAVGTMDANKWPDTTVVLKGRIFVYAGSPQIESVPVDTLTGDTVRAGLGVDLASGDMNDDGKDELVALGFNESCNNYPCSYTYISLFSSDSGFHMKRDLYIDSRHVTGGFGPTDSPNGSVACFDADGDGIKDILVSGICIFRGGSRIDTLPTYRVGPPDNDTTVYGAYPWVGGGGDYNGDGIPDILLASQRRFGVTNGVFVMVDGRGHPGQHTGYRVYADYGAGTVNLGGSPENAGNVNGDRVDDIIMGNGGWPYTWSYGFFGIYSGDTSMIAPVKERKDVPKEFNLNQNYPNPFNPSTAISYQLSAVSNVTLKVFDTLGREVKALVEERETAGHHIAYWDGTDQYGRLVATGVYYFRLTTLSGSITKKGVLIK